VIICKKCLRVFGNKRWTNASPGKLAHARLMDSVKEIYCPDCLRHKEGYTAILQVRGRFDEKEVEAIIFGELDRSGSKGGNERVYKKNESYRFTSKAMANKVASLLAEKGAEVSKTSKIITRDSLTSKDLTRTTIVARFNILPGDIVKKGTEVFLVQKVTGDWAWLEDGKKTRTKSLEVVEGERLEGVVISEKPAMIFIESTGETLEIEKKLDREKKVIVVRYKDRVFVI
jgi:NMD protein affecting ribosome stability and mRNA decay